MDTRTKHRRGNLHSRLDQFPTIVPDGVAEYELAPRRKPSADALRADTSQDERPKTQHKKIALSDPIIDARIDYAEGRTIWLYDHGGTRSVAGLRLRIGPRSAAWVYVRDRVDHGRRRAVYETLGRYDRGTRTENPVRDLSWHMGTDAARDAAAIKAGRAAGGRYKSSSSKGARKFSEAFADYLVYLKEKAEDAGKPARWMEKVARLGNSLILPEWGKWSLAEMSERRAEVADWHKQISKGRVTSANHAIRIIRAIYIREARRDDSLTGDPTKLPSAAVTMRREKWQRANTEKPGLASRDFPKWLQKWRTLPPIRRAYHLTGLLTGARPGELARTPWSNLDPRTRTLTIGNSKAGNDIPIPLSGPIARALKLARDACRGMGDKSGLIFPSCEQAGHHEPIFTTAERGHSHRRTWKTVATDCEIPDELSGLVLGHIPEGMSMKYALRKVLLEGRTLRKHQAVISRRIVRLLGTDPMTVAPIEPPPHPRDLARQRGEPRFKSTASCRAGHIGERYTATGRCVACAEQRNTAYRLRRKR